MDRNAGEWLKKLIWRSCKAFTNLVFGKSCIPLGQERSQTMSSSNSQSRRALVLFLHGEDGHGSVMYSVRRESTNISKLDLSWTPEGKKKRGCLKSTWRRTAEAELMSPNLKWGQAPRLALEQQEWKKPDNALCTPWRAKDCWWSCLCEFVCE